jgi:hypothetical protein
VILASALYLFLTVLLFALERNRTRDKGPDFLSIFVAIFALQNILPGVVIPFLLSQYVRPPVLDIGLFDRIYQHISPTYVVLSAMMSLSFILALYIVYHKLYSRHTQIKGDPQRTRLQVVPSRLWLVMLLGVLSSYFLLKNMGQDSLLKSYGALALFRAGGGEAESPTFANANLFALTQTFSLLSIIPFVYFVSRPRGLGKFLGLAVATAGVIAFSSLCVSRRALPLDILLIYFTLVIVNKRWYLKFAGGAFLLFLPVLIYGKTVIYSISAGGNLDVALEAARSTSASDALLVGFSYLGISLISSWGTFMFLDTPFRYGVDHILSMLRRIPLGSFGIDKEAFYPERIVRISTRTFLDSNAQDVPPGLMGQMWLDCGILGPVIWGIVFAVALSFLQIRFDGKQKTLQSTVFFMIWLYIVSLPMNSGSFDFVFSVDVFFLVIFLWFVYKRVTHRRLEANPDLARLSPSSSLNMR